MHLSSSFKALSIFYFIITVCVMHPIPSNIDNRFGNPINNQGCDVNQALVLRIDF